MRILKKRRISAEKETITCIFMKDKSYRVVQKEQHRAEEEYFMNTCISTKRRNRAKNNANSVTNKTKMTKMITKKMKTRRKSGTIYLTGSLLRTLYCP